MMASPGTLLFSLRLVSLLHSFISADSLQTSKTLCPSFNCGNGISIKYPFWHQIDRSSEHCGYPGFNVSCNDQSSTLIHLSNKIFRIRSINYSDNSLVVVHFFEPKYNLTCPSLHQDFTLPDFSLFKYSISRTKKLRFFYNCTLFPPSLASIACLGYNVKRSFMFVEGAIPEFDWNKYCESTASVPVIDKAVGGLAGALQEGFELTWQQPDFACQSCEATGGFCGYSNANNPHNSFFFCHCPDGKHSINCHDNSEDSIKLGPNYTAIGALLFGGLIMAATVFYFIQNQKKRFSAYKPVSQ